MYKCILGSLKTLGLLPSPTSLSLLPPPASSSAGRGARKIFSLSFSHSLPRDCLSRDGTPPQPTPH